MSHGLPDSPQLVRESAFLRICSIVGSSASIGVIVSPVQSLKVTHFQSDDTRLVLDGQRERTVSNREDSALYQCSLVLGANILNDHTTASVVNPNVRGHQHPAREAGVHEKCILEIKLWHLTSPWRRLSFSSAIFSLHLCLLRTRTDAC